MFGCPVGLTVVACRSVIDMIESVMWPSILAGIIAGGLLTFVGILLWGYWQHRNDINWKDFE
jgi:predicted anti-sigma-YlaC factor YlaD